MPQKRIKKLGEFHLEKTIDTLNVKISAHYRITLTIYYKNEPLIPFYLDEMEIYLKIRKKVITQYYKLIRNILFDDKDVIIRLGGAHFDMEEFVKIVLKGSYSDINVQKGDYNPNFILQYYRWMNEIENIEYDSFFVLIKTKKQLFNIILRNYWFSLGKEVSFIAIQASKRQKARLGKNFHLIDDCYEWPDLINCSTLFIDNYSNGLTFQIKCTSKKDLKRASDIIDKYIKWDE